MEKMTIDEIQKVELTILKEVVQICEELEITYWGIYGTLIGAIRHKGFIPWDDDLDIAMKREDYEKFIAYFKKKYRGKLQLHCIDAKEDYPYYIARVSKEGYKLIFDQYDYTSGVFIDIYPLDGMGNSKEFWLKSRGYIKYIHKGLECAGCKSIFLGSNWIKKIVKIPFVIYCKWKGKEYFYQKIDSLSQKYKWEESKYIGVPVWASDIWFNEKEDYAQSILVPFEDMMINVPKNYDAVLSRIYGDYMQLPPLEKRVPQHGYTAYKMEGQKIEYTK